MTLYLVEGILANNYWCIGLYDQNCRIQKKVNLFEPIIGGIIYAICIYETVSEKMALRYIILKL